MFSAANKKISIPNFYENKSVFITGATGFIGRLLVEKLLRDCPGINKIYVLLRPKKGKNVQDRIKDIVDIPIFDKIRSENIKALDKIIPISGDSEKIGLGISEENKKTIIENVTIIFHVAASVRFDDLLKKAIVANVTSAREVVLLARQLKKIDVFVHTSTGYSNCDNLTVEEKLYAAKMDWRDLIKIAEEGDDRTLEILTQKLIYPMPNTYTFTKAIGEQIVFDLSTGKIPTVILRPTIVLPTYYDPLPGWVDNLNGPVGMLCGIGKGITRAVYGDVTSTFDHCFADSVVKGLIVSSWKKALSGNVDEIQIYNISSDLNYSLADLFEEGTKYIREDPLKQYLWPGNVKVYTNYYIYYFNALLKHFLPALLVDLALWITNRRTLLFNIQRKAFIANTCLIYFMSNTWNFVNKNYMQLRDSILVEDEKAFSIDHFGKRPNTKDTLRYIRIFFNGMRTYIAKEGPTTKDLINKHKWWRFVGNIWNMAWLFLILYFIFFKNNRYYLIIDNIYKYFENLN